MEEKKIWMMASGGIGDIACSTSLLHFKDELWPGDKIVWFVHPLFPDILKYNDKIDEVRIVDEIHTKKDCKIQVQTAPWGNQRLIESSDTPYTILPMKLMKKNWPLSEWHPCIYFSEEEDIAAKKFVSSLPYPRTIMLETFCRSGQSTWNNNYSLKIIKICREIMGNCNFIFASKKGFGDAPDQMPEIEGAGLVDGGSFTARQLIPVYNKCDMFIGISSGISCLTCSWSASPNVKRVEYVYFNKYSTELISRGPISSTNNIDQVFKFVSSYAEQIGKP